MANDSSTGGYLSPVSPAVPEQDADLDALLQPMVAGITGLAGSMVRPRWQPVVPRMPEIGDDWCAIGVVRVTPEDTPYIRHDPGSSGSDVHTQHEVLEVLASFYGPASGRYAGILRAGIFVEQNREQLRSHGIALVSAGQIVQAPDLLNQQWRRRMDLTLTLRRVVTRTYQVLNIQSAEALIHTDMGITVDVSVSP